MCDLLESSRVRWTLFPVHRVEPGVDFCRNAFKLFLGVTRNLARVVESSKIILVHGVGSVQVVDEVMEPVACKTRNGICLSVPARQRGVAASKA